MDFSLSDNQEPREELQTSWIKGALCTNFDDGSRSESIRSSVW